MLNSEFNDCISEDKAALDFYPEAHRAEIDEINEWVYETVNSTLIPIFQHLRAIFTTIVDGVYRCGFSKTQEAYEKAVTALFDSLDRLEIMLTGKDYLVGDKLTEADIRLWVTIVSCPLCLI